MLNKCTNKLIVVNLNKPLSMKNLILCVLSVLFISSCVSVEFTSPQPSNEKSLKKFPKEMRGDYLVRIISGDEEPALDTLKIRDKYYLDQSKANDSKVFLSDSCIIKSFNNDYFINFKGTNEVYWTVALLRLEPNKKLMVYGLFAGEDMEEEPFIEALNSITTVHKVVDEEGTTKYDISPSNEELSRLITEQYFKPVYELIRIKE